MENNKIKNNRVVTFKEDYPSKPGAQPIAKKGEVHALNVVLAAQLKDKGAKIEIKEIDYAGGIKRAKEQLAKNREKEGKMMYA